MESEIPYIDTYDTQFLHIYIYAVLLVIVPSEKE